MEKDLPRIWIIRRHYTRASSRDRSFGIHTLPLFSGKIKGPGSYRTFPFAGEESSKDEHAIHIRHICDTIISMTCVWLSILGYSLNTVFRIRSRQPRFSEAFNSEFLQIQGVELVAVVVRVSSPPQDKPTAFCIKYSTIPGTNDRGTSCRSSDRRLGGTHGTQLRIGKLIPSGV